MSRGLVRFVRSRFRQNVSHKDIFGGLVDLIGFEPMTSSMPWKRAPNCATGPAFHLVTSREYHTTRTRTLNFRLPKKMLRIGTLTIDSVSNQRHNQTVGLRLS